MSASAALTLEQGLASVAGIVGEEHVQILGETLVAAPGDVRQVAEVLRFAGRNGITVMPSGGGTKRGWGNPLWCDIELSTRRLGAIREHAWQDMTCTVGAGCRWAALQEELKQHGQMVALDPVWPEHATVGGVVACNDSGALRLKYGGLRDLILGMTMVLADGTIARSGGKVVKNVAGYDLHKLMTGSLGTLGVITEVSFRLHPIEEHAQTWTAITLETVPGNSAFLGQALRVWLDSQLAPSCVQLRASRRACSLDIRIAAPAECMDEYGSRIRSLAGKLKIAESGNDVWNARQELFHSDALILKVSVLPSEICAITSELQRWADSGRWKLQIVAYANGLITVAVDCMAKSAIALMERLRAQVKPFGGSVVALQAPGALRSSIDVWGPDPGALPLMREIKERFDSGHILNPGRFVGKI